MSSLPVAHGLSLWRSPLATKWALRLVSLSAMAVLWEFVASRSHSLLLPRFTDTLVAFGGLVLTAGFWDAVLVSNQAMVSGFLLAAVVGITAGLAMGRWRIAERFLDPYLTLLLATPVAALAPILIMATGMGVLTRLLIVFAFSFVSIAVNTRVGLRSVEPDWIEMARTFGATEWQLWRTVLLRGALPAILTGLRVGLAQAITGMIFVELWLLALGIGRLIIDFQAAFDSAGVYATVLALVVESVLLMKACNWLERRAIPWTGEVAVP